MLNNVCICGRMTADPVLNHTQSGMSVVSFTVAVDGNTKEKHTDFINCVAWRGVAEIVAKYFTKGKPIIVTGRIQTRNFTTKDGDKRIATEVIAENVYFCGDKHEPHNTSNAANDSGFDKIAEVIDELPF